MGKYNTGDVVGPYTLIELIEKEKWKSECNICGSIVDIITYNAKHSKMCKYCRTKNNIRPRNDLTGQRFGRLTVMKYLGESRWLCLCDCGNECVVLTEHLTSGHTQSCGCYMKDRNSETHFKDLTGQRFGLLTVKKRIEDYVPPNQSKKYTKYECECDCGICVDVLGINLTNGNTTSCGHIVDSEDVKLIKKNLVKSDAKYKIEFAFPDLKSPDGYLLRFDFALKNYDNSLYCVIEYQGEQHFYQPERTTKFGKQAREVTDKLKREYCKTNNIKLEEIRYDEDVSKAIEKILNEYYACQSRAKQVVSA